MKKKSTKQQIKLLHKKCWHLMSFYIRTKDIDDKGNTKCYTCGKTIHYSKVQAGHFIHNRIDMAMHNLKPQCIYCNKYLHGNLGNYAIHLVEDYDINWVKDLVSYAKEKGNSYTLQELNIVHEQLKAVLAVNHQLWLSTQAQ